MLDQGSWDSPFCRTAAFDLRGQLPFHVSCDGPEGRPVEQNLQNVHLAPMFIWLDVRGSATNALDRQVVYSMHHPSWNRTKSAGCRRRQGFTT
jgi:hypothetical protein